MSPDADFIVAVLGRGPATETRLRHELRRTGVDLDDAAIRTKNAIVEAFNAGKIEMPMSGVYRVR